MNILEWRCLHFLEAFPIIDLLSCATFRRPRLPHDNLVEVAIADLENRLLGLHDFLDDGTCHVLLCLVRRLRLISFLLVIVFEVLNFLHSDIGEIIEYFLLLRLLTVNELRVCQIEELHEAEVLQLTVIVLEEATVESTIVTGT